jgi:Ni,Fe-hydrogenase III small subunit
MHEVDDGLVGALAARLDAASEARLGRSLVLYAATTGDCGGCALEMAMLAAVSRDLARLGVVVQDTPVGADVLLVTGAMTRALVAPVQRALRAMAAPCWVMAVGDCAVDGGVFAASAAVAGGAGAAVPVDLVVPGCPPPPAAIVSALQTLLAANAA